jgi:hypothetical protein
MRTTIDVSGAGLIFWKQDWVDRDWGCGPDSTGQGGRRPRTLGRADTAGQRVPSDPQRAIVLIIGLADDGLAGVTGGGPVPRPRVYPPDVAYWSFLPDMMAQWCHMVPGAPPPPAQMLRLQAGVWLATFVDATGHRGQHTIATADRANWERDYVERLIEFYVVHGLYLQVDRTTPAPAGPLTPAALNTAKREGKVFDCVSVATAARITPAVFAAYCNAVNAGGGAISDANMMSYMLHDALVTYGFDPQLTGAQAGLPPGDMTCPCGCGVPAPRQLDEWLRVHAPPARAGCAGGGGGPTSSAKQQRAKRVWDLARIPAALPRCAEARTNHLACPLVKHLKDLLDAAQRDLAPLGAMPMGLRDYHAARVFSSVSRLFESPFWCGEGGCICREGGPASGLALPLYVCEGHGRSPLRAQPRLLR